MKSGRRTWAWAIAAAVTAFGLAFWNGAAEAQDHAEKPAASAAAHDDSDSPPAAATASAAAAAKPEVPSTAAPAQPDKEEADEDEPVAKPVNRKGEVQEIGVLVTAVNKIDVLKESFEYDALVTIATKGKLRKCAMDTVQDLFPEGTVKKVDEFDDWEEGGKKFRQCKVTVDEQTTIDVSRYPFDRHELEITVGDESDSVEGVEFKPIEDKQYIGVSDSVKVAGWEFGDLTPRQDLVKQPHAKAELSQAVFSLQLSRPGYQSLLKGFLGAFFQLAIALVALVLAVKAAPNRIALVTGALIATATAHNQISGQIGVSYLTTADKFFFVSYLLLLLNVIFTALMVRAEDTKNDARIKFLYKLAWYVLPALTVVLTTLVMVGVI